MPVIRMSALGIGKGGSNTAVMPNKHAFFLPPLCTFNRFTASSDQMGENAFDRSSVDDLMTKFNSALNGMDWTDKYVPKSSISTTHLGLIYPTAPLKNVSFSYCNTHMCYECLKRGNKCARLITTNDLIMIKLYNYSVQSRNALPPSPQCPFKP